MFGEYLTEEQLAELTSGTTEWQAFRSLLPLTLQGGGISRTEAIIEVQQRIERVLAAKGSPK